MTICRVKHVLLSDNQNPELWRYTEAAIHASVKSTWLRRRSWEIFVNRFNLSFEHTSSARNSSKRRRNYMDASSDRVGLPSVANVYGDSINDYL